MYSTNIQPESEVRGSLPLINPEPEGQGVYQCKLPMTEDKGRIVCRIHRNSRGSYDIYYGDVILVLSKHNKVFYKHCTSFPSCFEGVISNDLLHVRAHVIYDQPSQSKPILSP